MSLQNLYWELPAATSVKQEQTESIIQLVGSPSLLIFCVPCTTVTPSLGHGLPSMTRLTSLDILFKSSYLDNLIAHS